MAIVLPDWFQKEMKVLSTIFSPVRDKEGILVAGEGMFPESKQPIVRLYLIKEMGSQWRLAEELQAFAFYNYHSAFTFKENLPKMSALDLIMRMNSSVVNIDRGLNNLTID